MFHTACLYLSEALSYHPFLKSHCGTLCMGWGFIPILTPTGHMSIRWNHARRMGINPVPTLEPSVCMIGTILIYDWPHLIYRNNKGTGVRQCRGGVYPHPNILRNHISDFATRLSKTFRRLQGSAPPPLHWNHPHVWLATSDLSENKRTGAHPYI